MLADAKRIYALREFTVERKAKGWYFTLTYGQHQTRGPYGSVASVALMIARELMKEIVRRDRPYNVD